MRSYGRHVADGISPCVAGWLLCALVSLHWSVSAAARQNPLKDPRICGRPQCEPLTHKFSYANKLYKYDYTVDLQTEFSGIGGNSSELRLKTKLNILFPKPCEGLLEVKDVEVFDGPEDLESSNESNNDVIDYYDYGESSTQEDTSNRDPRSISLANDLKMHLLRFSFIDGHITELCPSPVEPVWVLNIKKGILSAFQNTMLRFDVDLNTTETDVSGECNVQYSLESTDNEFVTIRKNKDIASCRNRYSTHSILQTTPYTFRDEKTIWPILSSESYCNLTLDRNIYKEINCFERHLLIPFSNSSTGAVTTAISKFEFDSEESFSYNEYLGESNYIQKRTTLVFDHTPAIKPTHGNIKIAKDQLEEMCTVGFPTIKREFIDVFTNFLQTTKSLDYKALTELLARAKSICDSGRNHVLESLPYIGSTASYQLMRDQIIANAIPIEQARGWMTSLSFIQRPDEETLETFYTILEFSQKETNPEYTLGSTAVIHGFCKYNENCETNSKVEKIIQLLETEFLNLFKTYGGQRNQRERMIVLLKGIGNIGVVSDSFGKRLEEIIVENDSPIQIRLHAVLAFRRVDCAKYRYFFLNTYGNFTLNTEIRIFSYLQAMRCPNYKSIAFIKTTLEVEQVNQVGSYVWSHLKNLVKSSSPVRVEAQGLLLNDDLSDKFKMDIRKFSRNYEHSLFFDEYNFGTTTDMNLIFGTESYLPRMATLNFTADLFGQSVNFFEFSARAEGFEELAAAAFGPTGLLNNKHIRKKLSFLNRWINNESAEADDSIVDFFSLDTLRLKRNIYSDQGNNHNVTNSYVHEEGFRRKKRSPISDSRKKTLQKNIDEMGYKLKYDYNNPRAQIGLRIFGNDLQYLSLEGLTEVHSLVKESNPFFQAQKILSGKDITYSKSNVFLDASYNVPLAIGLPLSVHAFGASTIDLHISGNLDRIQSSPELHFDVEGRFKPSISVDVITTMQSDLFYAVSGIKVKSNLYSNSEVEAKLKMRGNKLVQFSFNLPQDTNEIFSARSELVVMQPSGDLALEGIEKRRSNSSCTWPVLDNAIGLKMCTYFSVPDLSSRLQNSTDIIYPSLLLSGPLNLSVILTKSDLSAKKYMFEYKWDQIGNDSQWSLVFHTPNSAIKRLLVTNVTSVLGSFNASVSFMNGASTASAGCQYSKDANSQQLQVFLDNNGNRSLNLDAELKHFQDRNTWVYKPKFLLAVNGLNVTGLVGVIRLNAKNGIAQHDIELSFETKKLQALVQGNFVQTEVTTSTNMTVNYRFQANKVETVNFEGKLLNVVDRSKTEYRGNVKMKTSAYPALNFVSNVTLLSLQGHTEAMITYNNAPNLKDPKYSSLLRIIFARASTDELKWEGTRTRAIFEIKVPKSKIDFRFIGTHEERSKSGIEHNVILGLRYAPEKEATGVFSVHLPKKNLFAIDTYMNITIPEFNSCTMNIKITEKADKDYVIMQNGSWFTGHSIRIRGNYVDRSFGVEALHNLKLIIESPSFELTTLNALYERTPLQVFTSIQSKYGKDPYGLTMKYASNVHNENTNAEIRLKIKQKLYGINAKLLSEQPKMLQLEIHVDKLRDIIVKLGLLNLEKRKEITLELQWDANRDPSQRLGLSADYSNPSDKKYKANMMLTHPDRAISCGFEAFTGGPKYFGNARLAWGINDVVILTYDAGIVSGDNIDNWLNLEVITPFEGWHRNNFSAGLYNSDNLVLINSTFLWADNQNLHLTYKSNYSLIDPIISFDVRFGINSTVKDIPTIMVKVKHWHDQKKFDTELALRYSAPNISLSVYNMKSNWIVFESDRVHNVSGTVLIVSPFEGYHKGGLAARFSLKDHREVQGAASMSFDIRQFTLAIDGYVNKYLDNMLTINITTPLEKFRTINGRFGLNDKKRHAVAEVRAPTSALGAEVLADFISLLDFDVKLSVATPIESFQQAAVIGKIKPNMVDMRGVWNNITLGFIGVWHYQNLTNFEYSYMAYTPIAGFEENGFVVKFVKIDHFVFHVHGKLAQYKLGVRINGKQKSKIINQQVVELETMYDDDFHPPKLNEYDTDYDIEDEPYVLYYVDFSADCLIWPTIYGWVDYKEISDYFLVTGSIQLPQGPINIKDRFYYPDYLNALNVLTFNTPFQVAKDVKLIVEYQVDLNFDMFYDQFNLKIVDDMGNATEVGMKLNYTKIVDSDKPKEHVVKLYLRTPFEMLQEIDINGRLKMDESMYSGNISSRTDKTFVSLEASVETDEKFIETSVGILLKTDVIPHYACKAYFKKDFSQVDNFVDIQFEVMDNNTLNKLEIESSWRNDSAYLIHANGKLKTTMLPLKLASSAIVLTSGSDPQLNFDLTFLNQQDQRTSYGTRASKKRDVFDVEIWTPMKDFRNISMHGSIVRSSTNPNQYKVNGQLYRNMGTYGLHGIVLMDNNWLSETKLRVQPKAGGRDGIIELTITRPNDDNNASVDFRFNAIEDGKRCEISGGYSKTPEDGMDFSVLVQSTEPEIARININGKLTAIEKGRVIGDLALDTPWKQFGIDHVKLRSEVTVQKNNGKIEGEYRIGNNVGRGTCIWSWILEENVKLILESYMERPNAPSRIVHASVRYLNPDKNFQRLTTGGKLIVDSKWNLEVNGSVNYRSTDDFQFGVVTQLPQPMGDVHHISGRYRGNLLSKQGHEPNVFVEGRYSSQDAKKKFLSRVSYRNVTDLQGSGRFEWGAAENISTVEGDFQMLRKAQVRREFYAKLITPKFKDESTFFITGNYDFLEDNYHNLICSIDYPESSRVADMNVGFQSISNMHGHFNSTSTLLNVSWFNTDFNFTTNSNGDTYRFCQGTWPTDSAFFKLKSKFNQKENVRNLKGKIELEVPLATRHRADIEYGFNELQKEDNGLMNVIYNENQILNGKYKRFSREEHPIYTDTTDITLQNELKPIGIHYVNVRNFSKPEDYTDIKHVELYELENAKNFNLTGELHGRTTPTGQNWKVVAIHPNRTLILTANYDQANERVIKHQSKLVLSETAWIGYNFEIGNYTTPGNESQNFKLEISYPKRNLSTDGNYYVTDTKFNSDVHFKWTTSADEYAEEKVVRTGLLWEALPLKEGDRDHQKVMFTLGHPMLEKDVTIEGDFYRGVTELLNTHFVINYSDNEHHLVEFSAILKDLFKKSGYTDYTFDILAHHMASELNFQFNGNLISKPSYFKTMFSAIYKHSFFPDKLSKFLVLVDLNKKEVDYLRQTPFHTLRFWTIPIAHFPVYGFNATIWDSPETNNTGYFYIDLLKKYARMEFNLTEDSSQNLQLVGTIPDIHSGYLDVWRNYEEIRIIDVSSYIKMNHSRLITGRLHWRPNIKQEIKQKINNIGSTLYNSFSEGIDFWIKSVYSETTDASETVWHTIKDYNQNFISDIGGLSVLEQDLQELRSFINESYEANDFYIKTVVNFSLTILDELALRDHIQSLPQIFTELWQAMGESGKALRNSIVWFIETIKTSYNNLLEAISRFFHGDSLKYLSNLLEKGVEKYDKFIKDLHISFIKYVERLWNKFAITLVNYWKGVLKRLEPHVFKLMTYIETAAWDLSKELFDFIYKRTNELAESKYFNKVSSFAHDVERLYRDIYANDAITNIKKYSVIAWDFLKEKYFKVVPFGSELNQVLTEIWEEIKELRNIPHVQVMIQKYNDLMSKVEWVAEELQLETRVHQLYALVRNKFRNYAMNALETADMYREAKTKFVFNPDIGIMDLEQKLPMSWHAFNETPKFEEIPEYKFLNQLQNAFSSTNSSIVRYIYNLRNHLDPKTWLPPYHSRALLIDSRHFMTFDHRFLGLNLKFEETTDQRRNAQCSYLLAHDFFQRNFTLMLEPATGGSRSNVVSTRKLSLIANGQLIEIDLGSDTLIVNGNKRPVLPVLVGVVIISRELDILTIKSDTDYTLQCNIQFGLCWFELSGWYYGQTAGLLGTMNNEHFDDFTTSKHKITSLEEEFTNSWSAHQCKQNQLKSDKEVTKSGQEICNVFFKSGILSSCAATVDSKPFYKMCLDLTENSNPIRTQHPAPKGACTSALAYIEACMESKIPMRVPNQCVYCQLSNGSYVSEGTFIEMKGKSIPQSSDVVFIVEAKPCNANLTQTKSIMTLVSSLNEQLTAKSIKDNRFAVVAFGGRKPFERSHSILYENRVFVNDYNELYKYFAHIETNNGTNDDILQAISVASKLPFRPGVSKTIVLLPCSKCASSSMRFDYYSILQFMREEGVNLHILADTEFKFEANGKIRHFFGLDNDLVYSKRTPEGEVKGRKQINISKSDLGICTELALKTNGTVFSARNLLQINKSVIKRFSASFAKRVASTATPNPTQSCECSGHNSGVSYWTCSPSKNPDDIDKLEDYDLEFNDWSDDKLTDE